MSTTAPTPTPARRVRNRTTEGAATQGRRRRKMSTGDKVAIALMVTIPTLLVVLLIWLPALSSVLLGFTRWEGIGGLDTIQWIGLTNYKNIFTIYPPFWPALQHNLLFLVFLFVVSAFGMFLAVLLDKEIRGSRFYQTAYYLPVVLSLALTGFIWQLMYSRDQGLINAVTGWEIDWFGDPKYNLWVVLVVTVINSLRAFDLVWIVNKGRNGLEIIAALVTQNVIGEASRIGFGSALATIMLVISSVFVVIYLNVVMREA